MDANDLFELASRKRFRFDSPKGLLATDDLWDLPLTSTVANKANLNDIARAIHHKLTDGASMSFVGTLSTASTVESAKLDIVKRVIAVKQLEKAEALAATERTLKKQRLIELIARKEDEDLAAKPLDELKKLVGEL